MSDNIQNVISVYSTPIINNGNMLHIFNFNTIYDTYKAITLKWRYPWTLFPLLVLCAQGGRNHYTDGH